MNKIPTSTLREMCELVVDCPHFTPEWTESGYVVIRNQNIRDGRLDLGNPSYTTREDFERRVRRAKPTPGDIIFTREAPMGEVCMVPAGLECCVGQRQVLLRPKKSVDGRYLFFALRSEYVRHQIFWNEGTGSTVSNVRIPVLEALKIPRMGTSERAIADVLGALDNKIELNREMSATLESIARALFQDWFVDFGPTNAKVKSGEAYLDKDLLSVFPQSFDGDGMPNGWRIGELHEIVELNPKESIPANAIAPYLDMAALPTSGSISDLPIDREFGSGTKFRNGDTLVARITPCLENGKTAFVQNLPENAVGWGSTEFIVLRPLPPVPKAFAYILARDPAFRAKAIQSMTGTSGRQRARTEVLEKYPVAIPAGETIWTAFGAIVEPLFDRIKILSEEIRVLVDLRETLLPKLMSGQVRLKDVENKVEKTL